MGFLAFQRDSAIVVLIGDNGAVVANMVGGIVRSKYFVGSVHSKEWFDVKKCFCENNGADVYMVLDHSSQVYSRHVPPASVKLWSNPTTGIVSTGVVDGKGFDTSFLVQSPDVSGPQLQCMIVESRVDDELYKGFLGLLSGNNSKRFKGVLLLSAELASIAVSVASAGGRPKDWVIFVVCTKAGDFRQVVLHKGDLFSSSTIKILPFEREQPSMVAGKIYQGVQDTVRDITAVCGSRDDGDVLLCMVVPGSIKSSLLSFDLKRTDISVLTPYELGKVLKNQCCVNVGSAYCDVVVLNAIMQNRSFRHLMHTRESLTARRSHKLKMFAIFPTFVSIALVGTLYMLNTVEILNIKNATLRLKEEFARLTEELRIIRDDQEFARINEMYDVVDLYKSLSSVSNDPIDILSPLSRVKRDHFKFTGFSWRATEDFGVSVVLRVLMQGGRAADLDKVIMRSLGRYRITNMSTMKDKSDEFVIHIEGE